LRTQAQEKKTELIGKYATKKDDTGSTEVQVALLTDKISRLTAHLATHRHDYATQRGLLLLVGHRRRLLAYLSLENVGRYHQLIGSLGLRK
jgi:small subunit ribosomal protein S15